MPDVKDTWAVGEHYEPFIGRWSRLIAVKFLAWISAGVGSRWLDVGCGTGALSETILQHASPSSVVGIDQSPDFADYATRNIRDARCTFKAHDAESLPFENNSFDSVVSGLVLNFIPHPDRAVQEMVRVTRPGGILAAYVWDYAGKMEYLRHFWDAAAEIDPSAPALDEGVRFPLCHPERLKDLFEASGLRQIAVQAIDADMLFRDFDDFWIPFLGGQGPAPGFVKSLTAERRDALRELLRTALPAASDGAIRMIARAWAVKGLK
jgi:SAM-dependent methyltransferase